MKSTRQGQFHDQQKKRQLLNWKFSFQKNFPTENNNCPCYICHYKYTNEQLAEWPVAADC